MTTPTIEPARGPVVVPGSDPAAGTGLDEQVAGRTVTSAFLETVQRRGDAVALRWRAGGGWESWTWAEYADRVARVCTGLRELGVERGQRVLIMMRNRPEFHVVDMATMMIGATPFSVYTSSPTEQLRYVAMHSGATVAVVESPGLAERFLTMREELAGLRHLVIVDDPDEVAPADVVQLARLLARPAIELEPAARATRPEDLATIIYTSGTTGPPKGAMITHRNACWTVASLVRALGHGIEGKRFISYLPMAHIAERMASHYIHVEQGTEITTCSNPARVGEYLREVRPQVFFAVPRVWEKARSTIEALVASDPDRQEVLVDAIELGRAAVRARLAGEPLAADLRARWEEAEASVLSLVRLLVGLDECEIAVSAAAPISPSVIEFFLAIGIPISELYGLSESCGPVTWTPDGARPGAVGLAIPGCEARLAPDGEILARGGNIFSGYLDDPERTAEALDDEGWLHTGDVGVVEDGQLRVVDRKKELIVTAGGENISPSNLEGQLRATPLIGQACVVGEGRPYLVALLTLDAEAAPAWARARNIDETELTELAVHPAVHDEVERAVAEVNEGEVRSGRIKRFTILNRDWPQDSDELTPTMKLKRRPIELKYAAQIDALYRNQREETRREARRRADDRRGRDRDTA